MIKVITTVSEAQALGLWSKLDDAQKRALAENGGELYVSTYPTIEPLNFFFREGDRCAEVEGEKKA